MPGENPESGPVGVHEIKQVWVAVIIAQQGLSKPPKRASLSFRTADFCLHRFGQHSMGSVPTRLSELVLEVLLSLSRDISPSPLLLKGGYEPAGCGRHLSVEVFSASATYLWRPMGRRAPNAVALGSLAILPSGLTVIACREPGSADSLAASPNFGGGISMSSAVELGAVIFSAALARTSKSAAIARYLSFVASRSAVSAIPRNRAASSRRNREIIVDPFRAWEAPKGSQEAGSERSGTNGEGRNMCMPSFEHKPRYIDTDDLGEHLAVGCRLCWDCSLAIS